MTKQVNFIFGGGKVRNKFQKWSYEFIQTIYKLIEMRNNFNELQV